MIPWELRRGQIKHLLYEHCLNGRISWEVFKEHIHELNRAEPIIRCRDCKWFTQFRNIKGGLFPEGECEGWGFTKPDDFCSRGERKGDGNDKNTD